VKGQRARKKRGAASEEPSAPVQSELQSESKAQEPSPPPVDASHESKPQREKKRAAPKAKPQSATAEADGTSTAPVAKPSASTTASETSAPAAKTAAKPKAAATKPQADAAASKPAAQVSAKPAPAANAAAPPKAAAKAPAVGPALKTIAWHIPDVTTLDPDYESDRMQHNFCVDGKKLRATDPKQWAAGQASHGMDKGCAVFAIKIMEAGECSVGWGAVDAMMRLGAGFTSFGLESSGQKVTNGKKEPYTDPFAAGDVIVAMLHLQGGMVGFQKNGQDLGRAFQLPKELQGVPFFPQGHPGHPLPRVCVVQPTPQSHPQI